MYTEAYERCSAHSCLYNNKPTSKSNYTSRSSACAGIRGPRGATPRSRSGGEAVRRHPSTKVRSSREEIPHVQGKRNPSKLVGVVKGIRGQTHWNHNHRKLVKLITWTMALSNSMKPSHACGATQDGSWWRGLTECGPLEKGMASHFSILALRTPWTVWKGKR